MVRADSQRQVARGMGPIYEIVSDLVMSMVRVVELTRLRVRFERLIWGVVQGHGLVVTRAGRRLVQIQPASPDRRKRIGLRQTPTAREPNLDYRLQRQKSARPRRSLRFLHNKQVNIKLERSVM